MGVMLDTNWRRDTPTGQNIVGWPTPGRTQVSAYQRIARQAQLFAQSGFTAVGLPPSTMGAAGRFSGGYDLKENYRLGTPGNPTAFGTSEELRAVVAAVHANGMDCYGDLVLHQYDGFDPTQPYFPAGADGFSPGRFPKQPSYFVGPPPNVAVDPVPDANGNFGFGAMAAYMPPGDMLRLTVEAAQWLAATTGMDGFRIDDVKGTNWDAVGAVLNAPGLSHLFAFGEYFDGNTAALWNWANTLMRRRAAVLDFGFKFNVGNICNNTSRAWMGALANIGYCTTDEFLAVTFVDSADTDTSAGEQVIWNKALAYGLMLTFPGYPRVYYRDWSTDADCYGLMPTINNFIYIHEHFAHGAFVPRLDTDSQVFIHERTGLGEQAPGCVAFFNNDRWSAYTRTVPTTLGPNQRVHEYTGKYGDLWTDYYGNLTATVPPNDNGFGSLVFAKWIQPEAYGIRSRGTSQLFEGAADLSEGIPIANGLVSIGRVLCAADTTITLSGTIAMDGWTEGTRVTLTLQNASGIEIAVIAHTLVSNTKWLSIKLPADGFYEILAWGMLIPAAKSAFKIRVDYTAPQVVA